MSGGYKVLEWGVQHKEWGLAKKENQKQKCVVTFLTGKNEIICQPQPPLSPSIHLPPYKQSAGKPMNSEPSGEKRLGELTPCARIEMTTYVQYIALTN